MWSADPTPLVRLAPARATPLPLLACLLPLLGRVGGLYDAEHKVAAARLYGNIDSYAYYYVDLIVGTPPQRVSVIVDTGSGVTAFPCKSCRHCGRHIDANFDIEHSSTAKWLGCGGGCGNRCKSNHCEYHQSYTEGSSLTGWWFHDLVRLGDSIQRNPPVTAKMGCHQDENKLFYTQKANGIMGIKPPGSGGDNVLRSIFADKPHINTNIFSICLAEFGGRLVVGGYNQSYHKGTIAYVPLNLGSYYSLVLSEMKVDGHSIGRNWRNTMIDSGTTYTYMSSANYKGLKNEIEAYCRRHANCGARQSGTCWNIAEAHQGLSRFPTIEVSFGSVKTNWVPGAYMYRKGNSKKWCYSFENDGPNAGTTLGASWMIHQEIIFDMPKKRVGIVQAKCPEYKDRPAAPRVGEDLSLPVKGSPPPNPAVATAVAGTGGKGVTKPMPLPTVAPMKPASLPKVPTNAPAAPVTASAAPAALRANGVNTGGHSEGYAAAPTATPSNGEQAAVGGAPLPGAAWFSFAVVASVALCCGLCLGGFVMMICLPRRKKGADSKAGAAVPVEGEAVVVGASVASKNDVWVDPEDSAEEDPLVMDVLGDADGVLWTQVT